MADFDPAQSFFPSDSLPESDDQPFPVPSAPTEELPPVREGLPPGYQMRHDIHYVEQLGSKAAGARFVFCLSRTLIDLNRSMFETSAR